MADRETQSDPVRTSNHSHLRRRFRRPRARKGKTGFKEPTQRRTVSTATPITPGPGSSSADKTPKPLPRKERIHGMYPLPSPPAVISPYSDQLAYTGMKPSSPVPDDDATNTCANVSPGNTAEGTSEPIYGRTRPSLPFGRVDARHMTIRRPARPSTEAGKIDSPNPITMLPERSGGSCQQPQRPSYRDVLCGIAKPSTKSRPSS
ncbi:hypothetical protein F5Y04DRAFT_286263 [Hypomontagnella monticulosa]|nr:hypothetical protein F5Y04DRAFT_286263 [Hypomontagnella monticulosa]